MLTHTALSRTIRSVQSGIWAKGMRTKPRRVLRWSCKTAGEAFGLIPNRLAVALAKSQDHRSILRGFSFGTGRQGALVNGPAWAAPEKHRPSYTRKRCRLACQRGTREHAGASGETNPAWKESLPPGWPGVFGLFKYLGREESPWAFTLGELMPKSRIDSKKDGGHNPPNSFL